MKKRRIALAVFLAVFAALVASCVYVARQPLLIVVDYPRSVLTEAGLFVRLRVGPFGRQHTAFYQIPLEFESQLIEWRLRDDVKVVEVME